MTEMEKRSMKSPPQPGSRGDVHPSLGAFRYFAAMKMNREAVECARGYLDIRGGEEDPAAVAEIYAEAEEYGLAALRLELAAGYPGIFGGDDRLEYLYPFAYGSEIDDNSRKRNLPPELVLAVIREESRFDETVESPSGALGLMQIMPRTGEWIGGKLGEGNVSRADLHDPAFNIAAGCWYLRFLLDRSDGSVVAALAAYNAGHGRMRSWKKRFHPAEDPLAALELIGPAETRRYVRRVLGSWTVYEKLASPVSD